MLFSVQRIAQRALFVVFFFGETTPRFACAQCNAAARPARAAGRTQFNGASYANRNEPQNVEPRLTN